MQRKKSTAIVLAAGQGKRMNSKVAKQFLLIKGKPVLFYSLECFQNSRYIDEIIVVTGEANLLYCREEIVLKYSFGKVTKIVVGGKERYDSVYRGLQAAKGCDYVFIHDGARPFITETIIEKTFEAVQKSQACVAAVPSKDTVRIADENGKVISTPDRRCVFYMQTPQAFAYPLIMQAYEKMQENMQGITDDAMVAERAFQVQIQLVEGDYDNIKITTPEDIAVAEGIIEGRC